MHLYKSIVTVGGFTFLSRITGFVRDALIAAILGVSGLTDAFFVAFKLPNFFRRFFAEGAFNAAFVPLFSGILVSSGPTAARLYGEQVFALLLCGLTGLVLFVEHFMPQAIFLFAPGFEATPERFQQAIILARITFPYILFISLASLLGGILNSMGKFAAAAGTPILLNLTMITALLLVLCGWILPGTGLAWAVFIAGILQLICLWIACYFQEMNPRPCLPRLSTETKKLIRLGIPGAVSAGVTQVNLFMDMIFASWLPTGAVSYLFYADRVNQLPLGVIGIAVSTALLPELSKYIRAGEEARAYETQNRALEFALAITLPAACGLIILGQPFVALLFERGAFTANDARATGYTLSAFAAGLPAYVLVKIFSTAFFAHQDTKTPMKIAIVAVGLNFILNFLLIGPFSYVGLALATAISSWINAIALGTILLLKKWMIIDSQLKNTLPRLCLSSLAMSLICYLLYQITPFPPSILLRLGIVGGWIAIGGISYVCIARLMGTFYFKDLQKFLQKHSAS